MVALKLRRKRKLGLVAALLAVMALAACDTQPATDITENAATLNAKGACAAGTSGTWEYQIFKSTWERVGPRHSFSCSQNTGEVAFMPERANYLASGTQYATRLVSRLDNGTVQTWDSNGTQGGTAYDRFKTAEYQNVADLPEAQFVQPEGEDPVAYASANCRTKEIRNPRRLVKGLLKITQFTLTLRTRWTYCGGQIRKMYPAVVTCALTPEGALNGWICDNDPTKLRAYSTGGDPEHGIYTYEWHMVAKDPLKQITYDTKNWCATNQISGSSAADNHRRHGSCESQPW